jgi:hemerythrin superfamily protein
MASRTPTRSQNRSSASKRSTPLKTTQRSESSGENRSDNQSSGSSSSREREKSAFSFGDNGGAILGAALAGAAIGFAANYGRKFLMQSLEATAGDWDEILAAEHEATLAVFDRMLATDESQTWKRSMLLMKLTHALDKHAHQEEMVVYPALRAANITHDADALEGEHGYIKTFLYDLKQMGPSAPNWLEKVREFRSFISKHMHMEEEEVFPSFKENLNEEQNAKITGLVNSDGFWMA